MSDTEINKKFELVRDYVAKALRQKIGDISDIEKTKKNILVVATGVIKDVLKASRCEEIIPTIEIIDVHQDCGEDHTDNTPVDPTLFHIVCRCKHPLSFSVEKGCPPDEDMSKFEEKILRDMGFLSSNEEEK